MSRGNSDLFCRARNRIDWPLQRHLGPYRPLEFEIRLAWAACRSDRKWRKRCPNYTSTGQRCTRTLPLGRIGCDTKGQRLADRYCCVGAKSFTLFSRSGQWITPPAGMQDIRVIPDSEYSSHPAPAGKHFYTHEGKEVMRNDPERFLKYRKGVDSAMQASFPIFLRDSQFHDHAITMMTCMIKQHIGPGRPDLEQLFIPLFSPGCRRNTVIPGGFSCPNLTRSSHGLTITSREKVSSKRLPKIVKSTCRILKSHSSLVIYADHVR